MKGKGKERSTESFDIPILEAHGYTRITTRQELGNEAYLGRGLLVSTPSYGDRVGLAPGGVRFRGLTAANPKATRPLHLASRACGPTQARTTPSLPFRALVSLGGEVKLKLVL
jgi:hypothetical protein